MSVHMSTHAVGQAGYAASFEARQAGAWQHESPWMRKLRADAMARFLAVGFPTTRDEEWKYTDVSPIVQLEAAPATHTPHLNGLASGGVDGFTFGGMKANRLVFVNGHYAPSLSQLQALPQGITLGSLAEHLAHDSELVQEHLDRYARQTAPSPFTDLNTAFLQDGLFLHVPNNTVIVDPIHVLFLGKPDSVANFISPRNLVLAGANSQVTLIEHYASASSDAYFTNAVTEIVAGRGANVDHYKLQMEGEAAFHVATLQVQQERDVRFASHAIDFGGRLVRNNGNAVMGGQGIECTLNGLFLLHGEQHVDNHTVMDHAEPNCNSFEVVTGVLGGHSRGVFNGKIFVRRDAQKTDAKQSNRNLLLSPDATINTKPQLEIFADDVKCTHGATIGQLDDEALFYLRARGIDRETARGLLTYAFANDVISGIKVEPVRAELEKELFARLAQIR